MSIIVVFLMFMNGQYVDGTVGGQAKSMESCEKLAPMALQGVQPTKGQEIRAYCVDVVNGVSREAGSVRKL